MKYLHGFWECPVCRELVPDEWQYCDTCDTEQADEDEDCECLCDTCTMHDSISSQNVS